MKSLLGKYCYSYGNSNAYGGEFDTFEDMAEELGDEFLFVNVASYGSPPPMPTGEDLVYYFTEQYTEYMEDDIFDYCGGDPKELATRLQSVLDDFFAEYPINYALVEDLSEEEKIELRRVRERLKM